MEEKATNNAIFYIAKTDIISFKGPSFLILIQNLGLPWNNNQQKKQPWYGFALQSLKKVLIKYVKWYSEHSPQKGVQKNTTEIFSPCTKPSENNQCLMCW